MPVVVRMPKEQLMAKIQKCETVFNYCSQSQSLNEQLCHWQEHKNMMITSHRLPRFLTVQSMQDFNKMLQ
jgi:hypothetical protein